MACRRGGRVAEGGGLLIRYIVLAPADSPNIITDPCKRASRVTRTVTRSAMGRFWHRRTRDG